MSTIITMASQNRTYKKQITHQGKIIESLEKRNAYLEGQLAEVRKSAFEKVSALEKKIAALRNRGLWERVFNRE